MADETIPFFQLPEKVQVEVEGYFTEEHLQYLYTLNEAELQVELRDWITKVEIEEALSNQDE